MNNLSHNKDTLRGELLTLLKKDNFFDFTYIVTPKNFEDKRLNRKDISNYPVYSTDPSQEPMMLALLQLYLRWTSGRNEKISLAEMLKWTVADPASVYVDLNTRAHAQRILNQFDIISLDSYCVCEKSDAFQGLFLVSSKSIKQQKLYSITSKLYTSSNYKVVHYFLTRQYPRLTNPIFYNGQLKDRTARILDLTASGKSSEEITQEIHISKNGVNYHLDKAKSLLNAKNKVELIFNAKTLCII
ncbi:hypothetical protein MACH09_40150 [Vibrio sp. MACH09]|uniref:helix-turn-helix transcriptional regulator n=1 Tax=Vibrio sp. MACH09 TaxID=3025122 RepID=UPI002790437B|nr:LuxR C-terminal-related transcriptional regulator [Vibrio sp. MACH09]GLO63507.1 hypothetical protein MACH09_40150 [Vibrio sp. MACH09]